MDFHAVAELFLDGGWHLVDATGMAQSDSMAIIGLGRDATDVSFLTSFGTVQLNRMNVGCFGPIIGTSAALTTLCRAP